MRFRFPLTPYSPGKGERVLVRKSLFSGRYSHSPGFVSPELGETKSAFDNNNLQAIPPFPPPYIKDMFPPCGAGNNFDDGRAPQAAALSSDGRAEIEVEKTTPPVESRRNTGRELDHNICLTGGVGACKLPHTT
jgi:hypothetical protein